MSETTLDERLAAVGRLITDGGPRTPLMQKKALAAIEEARAALPKPKKKRPRKIWTSQGMVDVPLPGRYRDPQSGQEYRLNGFLGSHSTVGRWGYAMTGWPSNWQDLELIELFPEEETR
jgi:hypothetical protein